MCPKHAFYWNLGKIVPKVPLCLSFSTTKHLVIHTTNNKKIYMYVTLKRQTLLWVYNDAHLSIGFVMPWFISTSAESHMGAMSFMHNTYDDKQYTCKANHAALESFFQRFCWRLSSQERNFSDKELILSFKGNRSTPSQLINYGVILILWTDFMSVLENGATLFKHTDYFSIPQLYIATVKQNKNESDLT